MNNPFFYTITILLSLGLVSCNNTPPENVKQTLELAGSNKIELLKVIDHYQAPKDSLKLKAAYFLIGNMANKYFYPNNTAQLRFVSFLDSIFNTEKYEQNPNEGKKLLADSLGSNWRKIKQEVGFRTLDPVLDAKVITSAIIIKNIDHAFKMWEGASWRNRFSFDEFCEYVLPYRNAYDKPSIWRESIAQKFNWALNSLKHGDLLYASKLINDSLDNYYHDAFFEFKDMDIKDQFKTRFGTCRQHSSIKIAALRSLAIPVAQVEALHGTSWVIVPDKDGKFMGWHDVSYPQKSKPLVGEYRKERYSKVFMLTYKIQPNPLTGVPLKDVPPLFLKRFYKDVTKEHANTMDVTLKLSIVAPKPTNIAYLCEFNVDTKEWDAAHWGKINNKKVSFDQMGLERIYMPMYYFNGQYYPAGNPIYLNIERKCIDLKSNTAEKKQESIFRKAPLNFLEYKFADLMVNTVFEGANNKYFMDATELFTIKDTPFFMEKRKVLTNRAFRFVRYRIKEAIVIGDGYKGMHVSDLMFCDKYGKKIEGIEIASKSLDINIVKNAFDNDIRTSFNSNEACWIGLDLGKPNQIDNVSYLFRNSFNTVEPGDKYELLYWEKEWKSLGEKIAKNDYVIFSVPNNAVLWLRNKTKGNKEMVFFMKNGKQIWG